jgi:hypothetical protein
LSPKILTLNAADYASGRVKMPRIYKKNGVTTGFCRGSMLRLPAQQQAKAENGLK